MNQTKIKSALATLCLACSIMATAQNATTTHTVERGETIESIAKKYNVTEEELIKANPDAAEMVFAGMKLNVPANTRNNTTERDESKSVYYETNSVDITTAQKSGKEGMSETKDFTQETDTEEDKTGKIEPSMEFAFPSLGSLQGDGAEQYKMTFGMQTSFGAKFFITNSLFAEAQIGYKYLQTNWKKKYAELNLGKGGTIDLTTHSIYLPLYFGAQIKDFTFKFGPYFDYIVSGREKGENHSQKFSKKEKIKDDKLSVGLNFCARYSMFGLKFNIGLTNYTGIKDCKEMAVAFVIGM